MNNNNLESNHNNIKKIKYKLNKNDINKEIDFEKYSDKGIIECSSDYLLKKFGKPIFKNNSIFKTVWYIKVKTSNLYEYIILIYSKIKLINEELKNNTIWNIAYSQDFEFINLQKLTKLFGFEYSNYLKQQEKLIKKENEIEKKYKNKVCSKENINQKDDIDKQNKDESKFIDIDKFKELDNDKLKEFTNDELACVLFTRFKESDNSLLKEALIIHRVLQDPENYNKVSDKYFTNKNIKSSKITNYKTNTYKVDSKKIKRDKSKYNNKKKNKN